ncbi:MAG: response regulator [Lachnospiraceae bacterium]|nr:response regulator [Lachnospiraceae bacterium]
MQKKDNEYLFNFIKKFFGITVFVLFLLFVLGQLFYPSERDRLSSNCEDFNDGWYHITKDGEKVDIDIPCKLEAEYGEVVCVATELPDDIEDNQVICFRSIWQDVEVYIDGELRSSYNTKDSRPFGKNSAFWYVFADLNKDDAGKTVEYRFSSESKYAGDVRACYIGDKLGVWTRLVSESGVRTIIIIFLLFLSVFCIVVCQILKYIYKKSLPLSYLVWTMFFCSVWMLSEVEFRQIIFKNVSILTYYTYLSLMVIPIPLLIYINDIQNERYKKVHIIPLTYVIGILIVCTFLQVFNVAEYVQMLPFMHIGIGTAIVTTIATITIDLVKRKIADYFIVAVGVYGLLFSAVGEMVLYYLDLGLSIGTVLAVGLMFLLVMAIIKTGQDIMKSEKKKQEAIVAREAQAKFLANMSHEIRTPINAVIGMNEMIIRESENNEIKEYADNVKRASNMLLGLVNDILDFSKIESGQFELVEAEYDVESLIKDEQLILTTRASGKPISINVKVDKNLPSKLFGDELRIKQVVTNIISNAVKYTDEGQVTLEAYYKLEAENRIWLCLSVEDTGIGIKKEDIPKIYDNFKRFELDKNRTIQGTGLGLSIAKQLIDMMKGEITVESEYGKGSKFTVSIPQRIVDVTPIGDVDLYSNKNETVTEVKGFFVAEGANILVVDDNAMNLSVIKALLKRTKANVFSATGGRECVDISSKQKFDMILLDHMMPDFDGVAALKMIRNDKKNPNQDGIIIALTANAIAGCREMYLDYGFTDYFSKPIEAEKLDDMLRKYLGKKEIKKKEYKMEMDNLLEVDKKLGLSYCMDSEDVYKEVLGIYVEQCNEYFPELDKHFNAKDWVNYEVIVHAIKSNSLNIGAKNFSKLSLSHEMAAKSGDFQYIENGYASYIENLKKLLEVVKTMM